MSIGFRVRNKRTGEYVTHASAGMGWPDLSEIRMRPNGDLVVQEEYGQEVLNPETYEAEFCTFGLSDQARVAQPDLPPARVAPQPPPPRRIRL